MNLGSYLLQVRNERVYSQRDLAEKSDVSPAEISRVESGKRQKPSPAVLRAITNTLVISYPYLMQLAGYMDETAPDEAPATEDVFRDESTGRIVNVSSGAREMLRNGAAWANVACRVSRELSEEDRQMLTVLAMQYLKKNRGTGHGTADPGGMPAERGRPVPSPAAGGMPDLWSQGNRRPGRTLHELRQSQAESLPAGIRPAPALVPRGRAVL